MGKQLENNSHSDAGLVITLKQRRRRAITWTFLKMKMVILFVCAELTCVSTNPAVARNLCRNLGLNLALKSPCPRGCSLVQGLQCQTSIFIRLHSFFHSWFILPVRSGIRAITVRYQHRWPNWTPCLEKVWEEPKKLTRHNEKQKDNNDVSSFWSLAWFS